MSGLRVARGQEPARFPKTICNDNPYQVLYIMQIISRSRVLVGLYIVYSDVIDCAMALRVHSADGMTGYSSYSSVIQVTQVTPR